MSNVHSGSATPESAQHTRRHSRRDASVACLHPISPPPFREELFQPDHAPGLVVAQDFCFACCRSQLPHELPARSARHAHPSIRLDSDNFPDGALPVCYHAGNGISFCTHA